MNRLYIVHSYSHSSRQSANIDKTQNRSYGARGRRQHVVQVLHRTCMHSYTHSYLLESALLRDLCIRLSVAVSVCVCVCNVACEVGLIAAYARAISGIRFSTRMLRAQSVFRVDSHRKSSCAQTHINTQTHETKKKHAREFEFRDRLLFVCG